jgi:ABC-type polysaccharide/polyol phosphate transport system ATPase subunit
MYAVKAESVSKQYRRGNASYISLRSELASLPGRLIHRDREPHRAGPVALDDVSFELEQGGALAVIGPNGAGKSTLLRLISRVSPPTGGRLRIRGRVGALIEVGAGIHPELTGRENIWLYGSILGLSRSEIRRRFDEIVAFAEVGHAMDMQAKYFSSGMQLRLGFAVASHIEPEIFVVDEALAVGDTGFQAKCIERMSNMVREGRTLLFVSHSLSIVEEVCRSALLIDRGRLVEQGTVGDVVQTYVKRVLDSGDRGHTREDDVVPTRLVVSSNGDTNLRTGAPVTLELTLSVKRPAPRAVLGMAISDGRLSNLVTLSMLSTGEHADLDVGEHRVLCEIPDLPLLPGFYEVYFSALAADRAYYYCDPHVVGSFFIKEGPPERALDQRFANTSGYGPVYAPFSYRVARQADS